MQIVFQFENLLFKNDVNLSLSKAGYTEVFRVRQAHPDNLLKLIDYRLTIYVLFLTKIHFLYTNFHL